MKAPIAPPTLCAAGKPDRWRRYKRHPRTVGICFLDPIRAISFVTFLNFFQNDSTLHRVYNPIRACLKKKDYTPCSPPMGDYPPAAPMGDYTPL